MKTASRTFLLVLLISASAFRIAWSEDAQEMTPELREIFRQKLTEEANKILATERIDSERWPNRLRAIWEQAWQGFPDAQLKIAAATYLGKGLPKSDVDALKWAFVATKRKNPDPAAVFLMGTIGALVTEDEHLQALKESMKIPHKD